jgi:long-chain fatty acid transport protein
LEGKVRKKLCLALTAILLLTSGLLANGLNLNGFGARAVAMGGAFVGLADDFTAVFWNPAGLALMKKGTFGLTGDLLIPTSKYALSTFSMQTNRKYYPAGLVGFFQPISDRIIVGVGAYTLSGLGADWNNTGLEAALVSPIPPSLFTPALGAYRWRSFIGSITIAPTIAVRLTDQIFFGATVNLNYGFFITDQWGEYQVIPTQPPVLFNFGQAMMDVRGWGYGATFGVLVKPSDMFSFGATCRLASKLKLSGTTELENLPLLDPNLPESSPSKLEATSPMWLAGGVAVKPLTNLTLTFDLQWTNWKKLDVLRVTFQDPAWNAAGETGNDLVLNWANALQVRGGLEYTMGGFAIRAGYYHDPHPAPDSTMNILVPSFTYNTVTAGIGYASGRFRVDFGVEYLMGQKRTVAPAPENLPGIYEMHILVPLLSLGYGW